MLCIFMTHIPEIRNLILCATVLSIGTILIFVCRTERCITTFPTALLFSSAILARGWLFPTTWTSVLGGE
ncbi:hypothetical protein EDC04DRAFT_2669971 [Pisolithus marmoratus]|nr:hypothetical protein EDC04DRAFT_2669971 [Pisolithus marmoratus]